MNPPALKNKILKLLDDSLEREIDDREFPEIQRFINSEFEFELFVVDEQRDFWSAENFLYTKMSLFSEIITDETD